jgi:hypothetical protein
MVAAREAMAVVTLPLLLPMVDTLPAAMAAVMVDTHLEATRPLLLLMVVAREVMAVDTPLPLLPTVDTLLEAMAAAMVDTPQAAMVV